MSAEKNSMVSSFLVSHMFLLITLRVAIDLQSVAVGRDATIFLLIVLRNSLFEFRKRK